LLLIVKSLENVSTLNANTWLDELCILLATSAATLNSNAKISVKQFKIPCDNLNLSRGRILGNRTIAQRCVLRYFHALQLFAVKPKSFSTIFPGLLFKNFLASFGKRHTISAQILSALKYGQDFYLS
jgi:hypothetical protein